LKIGLPIILVAWAVSEITRRVLEKFRLHYISKVSLKLSLASIIILGLMTFAAYFNLVSFTKVNPFAVILLITLVESVSLFQIKMGSLKTNIVSLETLLVAVLSYLFLASTWVSNTLISYSFLVFIPIFLNFFVGRLQGLRLSEFVRFRDIFKND
jgi:type III secretory pathway component EscS